MKLTLSVGGGVTGLLKEHTIDINQLDERTRTALMNYINDSGYNPPKNLTETWIINDSQEFPIDQSKMNSELRKLYSSMKSKLSYRKW